MRYESLFIAGLGSYLPKAVPVEDAIAQGRYDREDQDGSGLTSITVAGPDDSQPGMAAAAGRVALERSGYRGADVGLLLHAVTAYNGLDGWNAGCYLQQEILGGSGLSFEIRQLSNGAVASIELAAAYLAASPQSNAAMITAADQFAEPAWDRWRTSWGLVYADGASAAVISRKGGFARVRSAVTVTDPGLEGLHRGGLAFGPCPDASDYPIDFRARALDYGDIAAATGRIAAGLRSAVVTAATEAGIEVGDADHYVVPSFGRELLRQQCLDVLGIGIERSTWRWGTAVGHMGAADQFASLTYLSEAGRLNPGDRALIIGIGGGFNWSCVVLDIIESPAWAYLFFGGTMTGEQTLARLTEFFSRGLTDARELTPDTPLHELGVLNSLAMARLVAFIRSDLGVEIPSRALTGSHFRTLNEITALVQSAQTPR